MFRKYFRKEYLKIWLLPFLIGFFMWHFIGILSGFSMFKTWYSKEFDHTTIINESSVIIGLATFWIILRRYEKTFKKKPKKASYIFWIVSLLYVLATALRIYVYYRLQG